MKSFIVIAGAPGSGKSSVASKLQGKLETPLFEFGWIPEFRNTGTKIILYTEDEAMAFENLMFVVKNYSKHGFQNVIITDLENPRIEQLEHELTGYEYAIYTLRLKDEELLKSRVIDDSRSSEYRNWEEAIDINHSLFARKQFKNETFVEVDGRSVEEIVEHILRLQ